MSLWMLKKKRRMNEMIKEFYQNKVFPKLMNMSLGKTAIYNYRKEILTHAYGSILEIGIGMGSNLKCYPDSVKRITAIDSYVRKIDSESVAVDLYDYHCEDMKFEDHSFDTVVSTFCLCSVDSMETTLKEISRVLKPGGQLLLLEHGKSDNKVIQKLQNLFNPLFKIFACGCNINRDYFQVAEKMGFSWKERKTFKANLMPSFLAGFLYQGVAVKGENNENQ